MENGPRAIYHMCIIKYDVACIEITWELQTTIHSNKDFESPGVCVCLLSFNFILELYFIFLMFAFCFSASSLSLVF